MKYSIITPCSYRDIYRIQELKDNLEAQDFRDFEWIIICNNPDLNLKGTSLDYKIINFSPYNVAAARNAGLKEANGDFVVFVDADDYLDLHALNHLNNVVQLCNSSSKFIYDLNIYKTYEPEHYFHTSLMNKSFNHDDLPDQSIDKRQRKPLNRYFNYNNLNNNSEYKDWLKNRYWLLKDEHNYDDLDCSLSVNGKVISKDLINENHLKFDPHDYFYSNICFMLLNLEYSNGLIKLSDFNYIKVLHNNPIFDPSISQIEEANRWHLWLKSCFHSILKLNDETLINRFTFYIINRISQYFYSAVAKNDPEVVTSLNPTLVELQKILQLVDFNVIEILSKKYGHQISFLNRSILLNIKLGQFNYAIRKMRLWTLIRNFQQIYHQKGRGVTRDFYYLVSKLPVNSHVIFYESFLGRSFSDNPKYIYQYIQAHYPNKFLNVWSVDAKKFDKIKNELKSRPNTIVVKRWGFKYMLYLATAKYFVDNMRQPKWFIKRPGMRFIETWHGTPLKKLVFDVDYLGDEYSSLYKKIFYHQSRQWDHLLTDNTFSYQVFKHSFKYPQSKMLKSGYPRNDILTRPDRNQLAEKIKLKLGIPLDKRVILYAPTWRDNDDITSGHYKFKLTLNIALLKKYLSSKYVLILRTHYFVTQHLDTSSFGSFVYNESNYDDISELYLISDILITDYSSVFFDYAILRRPILYYVYDYDQYAKYLHGFYLDMKKDLPGPLIKTSKGVVHAIQNINEIKKRYKNRYNRFNRHFNAWDDGHASQRVVKALLKH